MIDDIGTMHDEMNGRQRSSNSVNSFVRKLLTEPESHSSKSALESVNNWNSPSGRFMSKSSRSSRSSNNQFLDVPDWESYFDLSDVQNLKSHGVTSRRRLQRQERFQDQFQLRAQHVKQAQEQQLRHQQKQEFHRQQHRQHPYQAESGVVSPATKLLLYSGHDATVMPLLVTLGIYNGE